MYYADFIDHKVHYDGDSGFEPTFTPSCLMDFQLAMVEWAVRKGRAAMFEDCGMGKTLQQLVWAQNVVEHTNKPVLVLTPLAVAQQTVLEAEKFDIEASRSKEGEIKSKIVVCNYDRLHKFDHRKFAGVVCDESSILKNFDGATKQALTDFMCKIKYRLLCTATAAPNDYVELGTSSEALGYLGYMDMLGKFFKNDQNSLNPSSRGRHNDAWYGCKWRFKGHAETHFWKWVCSWSRAMRKPSDLGFSDEKFELPPLIENTHVVNASRPMDGFLFVIPARGLKEQRQERAATVNERCEKAAELSNQNDTSVLWCNLNKEADLLEKITNDCVQVSGSDSDDAKEEKFIAFSSGQVKRLVTKPKIGALGLNWQHCNHMSFFATHSYEQYYQAVRRCWRFGQQRTVTADMITTEGESDVEANLRRKAKSCDTMFDNLIAHMREGMHIDRATEFNTQQELPTWL